MPEALVMKDVSGDVVAIQDRYHENLWIRCTKADNTTLCELSHDNAARLHSWLGEALPMTASTDVKRPKTMPCIGMP